MAFKNGVSRRPSLRELIGQKLTRIGQILKIDWLIYNPFAFLTFHDHAKRDAPGVIDSILAAFTDLKSCADVGSGSGAFAAEAQRRGLSTQACEHSRFGRGIAKSQGVNCVPFDLTQKQPAKLKTPIDLVYCFEVAEHLPPDLGAKLVEFLLASAPTVVFTAAPPGQSGLSHVNEQPQPYWIEIFKTRGATYDADRSRELAEQFSQRKVSYWFAQNVMVFHGSSNTDTTKRGQ